MADSKDKNTMPPTPQVLHTQSDDGSQAPDVASVTISQAVADKRRHQTYRPSHKATFIGLGVVVAILAVNAGVIAFVIGGQTEKTANGVGDAVTINSSVLEKLGVNRTPVGGSGEELAIGPNTKFGGSIVVSGNTSLGGELILNKKLSAQTADLANLQAGDTTVGTLNVNTTATASTLNLRQELNVVGPTRLQGAVTIGQLLTVNNSVNITGNLAVGGSLSIRSLQANNLTSAGDFTIGGHIVTAGSAPALNPGTSLGSNGTVSISGNDTAGTVAANIGAGGGNGILARISFRGQFRTMPHVVVTAIGPGAGSVYVTRNTTGFSIGVNNPIAPGGYAFDYIVVQ